MILWRQICSLLFMKTWTQVKKEYGQYLDAIKLKNPSRRISALDRIEQCLRTYYPAILKGYVLFTQIEKNELKEQFRAWKGKEINGAENQVFNDFYKLARVSYAQ